jgi:hypothetical protein
MQPSVAFAANTHLALKVPQGLSTSDCRMALYTAVLKLMCSLVHFAAHGHVCIALKLDSDYSAPVNILQSLMILK